MEEIEHPRAINQMRSFIGTEKHSMDDPEAVQNDLEATDKLTCGL